MGKNTVLLADNALDVVQAFRRALEPEFDVLATVCDIHTLLELAPQLKPDVIVVDIELLLNSTRVGQQLKHILPNTQIIVVDSSMQHELAFDALRHWASGYLMKGSASQDLRVAIREVLKHRPYLTPDARPFRKFFRTASAEHQRILTPRQREVLQLLAEGYTMKEVAARLHVSTRTVAFHKYNIMGEFGLKSNSELVRFAIKEDILASL